VEEEDEKLLSTGINNDCVIENLEPSGVGESRIDSSRVPDQRKEKDEADSP
jgi:hypothetical protein